MHTVEISAQFEPASLAWSCQISPKKKIEILRSIFNGPLNNVNFWDLYKVVKKLNSQ
ncbi:MAG: hypothetical protein HWN65_11990 [Candidatus Helarchaeota archaeon]|nr:hypothetical protein [Candidatus Helarchaeota archaeon]